MNDGEVVLIAPPLRYRIRPRALKVIVPAGGRGQGPAGGARRADRRRT